MAHGYYNKKGEWVATSTKAEATDAWRKERGYSTGGVYDMGGGEVVDTRRAATKRTAAKTVAAPTPAATLANTFTGYDVQSLQSLSAPTTTPTVANTFLATSGYGAPSLPYGARASAGIGENVFTGGGSYQYQQAPPAAPASQPYSPFSVIANALSTTGRATAGVLGIDVDKPYVSPWTQKKETSVAPGTPGQYESRAYYMGGSERAYLGPAAQAMEYFYPGEGGKYGHFGLGDFYKDIAPEDRKPPPVMNQSTVRMLTKSGPSYLEGVDYGPSMTMEDIERIYEFDPQTGHYLLKGGEPVADYGYPSGGYYGSAGYGYRPGSGYGSRGWQEGGNLVNWRIGF